MRWDVDAWSRIKDGREKSSCEDEGERIEVLNMKVEIFIVFSYLLHSGFSNTLGMVLIKPDPPIPPPPDAAPLTRHSSPPPPSPSPTPPSTSGDDRDRCPSECPRRNPRTGSSSPRRSPAPLPPPCVPWLNSGAERPGRRWMMGGRV